MTGNNRAIQLLGIQYKIVMPERGKRKEKRIQHTHFL